MGIHNLGISGLSAETQEHFVFVVCVAGRIGQVWFSCGFHVHFGFRVEGAQLRLPNYGKPILDRSFRSDSSPSCASRL